MYDLLELLFSGFLKKKGIKFRCIYISIQDQSNITFLSEQIKSIVKRIYFINLKN